MVGDLERVSFSSCSEPRRLVSHRYSPICVISLFCHVFVPLWDVICVTCLLSAVTAFIVHPLSHSFEEKDKVVMGFPHVWAVGLGWRQQQPARR